MALKITQCTSVCSFLTFVTEISSRFSLNYLQDLVSSILLKFLLSFTVNMPLFKVCSPFKNTQYLDVCTVCSFLFNYCKLNIFNI